MRIRVAGRTLEAPKCARPTQDHVRHSLFDRIGNQVPGTRMLELFAGSGAVGIEALCRGAGEVVFVEKDYNSFMIIDNNLKKIEGKTGVSITHEPYPSGSVLIFHRGRASVIKGDATRILRWLSEKNRTFDWAFADPPYDMPNLAKRLKRLGQVIAEGGSFILERRWGDAMPGLPGFELEDKWRMRDVVLGIYRRLSGEL